MQRKSVSIRLASPYLASYIPMAKGLASSLVGSYGAKTVATEDAIVICKLTPFGKSALILDNTELVVLSASRTMTTGLSINAIRAVLDGKPPTEVSLTDVGTAEQTWGRGGIPVRFDKGQYTMRSVIQYSISPAEMAWYSVSKDEQQPKSWFYIGEVL